MALTPPAKPAWSFWDFLHLLTLSVLFFGSLVAGIGALIMSGDPAGNPYGDSPDEAWESVKAGFGLPPPLGRRVLLGGGLVAAAGLALEGLVLLPAAARRDRGGVIGLVLKVLLVLLLAAAGLGLAAFLLLGPAGLRFP